MAEDSNWIILIKKRISIKNIDRLYLKKEKGKVSGRFTHYGLFTCLWISNIDLTYKARGAARVAQDEDDWGRVSAGGIILG